MVLACTLSDVRAVHDARVGPLSTYEQFPGKAYQEDWRTFIISMGHYRVGSTLLMQTLSNHTKMKVRTSRHHRACAPERSRTYGLASSSFGPVCVCVCACVCVCVQARHLFASVVPCISFETVNLSCLKVLPLMAPLLFFQYQPTPSLELTLALLC